jgi:xanthine dehydrogenase YagT iron-sulfur-binding subunit
MNESCPPGADDGAVSRRAFLKGMGTAALSTAALGAEGVAAELEKVHREKLHGPGAVPVTLRVNGRQHSLTLEPRVTLLEALRDHAGLTGAKEVCDRATCGACTVLIDGAPVYACMTLAIAAQGQDIITIEGLAPEGQLTAVQQAFIDHDGLQCGYCTPGMVLSVTALLHHNPRPTAADVRRACAGNLCRCGTYPRVFEAALAAAGVAVASRSEVIRLEEPPA